MPTGYNAQAFFAYGELPLMNNRVWIVVAIVVLGLGGTGVLFGWNLLPDGDAAAAKGTYAPWLGTWMLIWFVLAMSVTLAGFLFRVGTGKTRG
jgi:hypothetical protein